MAKYKKLRKFDVTTMDNDKSGSFITAHINNRLEDLINNAGGTKYFQALNTELIPSGDRLLLIIEYDKTITL